MSQAIDGQRGLVLVVDDQQVNVHAVGALLTQAGFAVVPAMSGVQAFERLQHHQPDLILLDMLMPEMNGFEVCQRAHADPKLAVIPIVFLTAANERDALVRAFQSGAVDYVTKPFFAEELLARVHTHIELKRSRDHLVRIARERAELTQIVAHDLKNPLCSIKFAAQMISEEAHNGGDRNRFDRFAKRISTSSEEALSFIHSYLEQWADGDQRRRFEFEPVSLDALAQGTIAMLEAAASARRITLKLSVTGDDSARLDGIATRHAMENLISNAIKYGPEGSTVDITIAPGSPGTVRFSVMDRGPGLNGSDQKRLFERYVRLGDGASSTDSHGLGLAITKREITQLGGHLWFEPRAGGGAVFQFELPLAAPRGEASSAA